jgi:hypothetical protein
LHVQDGHSAHLTALFAEHKGHLTTIRRQLKVADGVYFALLEVLGMPPRNQINGRPAEGKASKKRRSYPCATSAIRKASVVIVSTVNIILRRREAVFIAWKEERVRERYWR